MRWLVSLCVRYAGTIATLTLIALLAGLWATRSAPLDVFPDFVPSTVDIQTEAPGFTAQQVEQLVTKPIENAVNGTPGLATMRSESIPGLSLITIQFSDNINLYNARQGISERLSELGSALPAGVGTPKLSPLTSSTMDLLKIGLLSDKLTPFQLRDQAEWVMKPALLAVPGVAHVIIFGGAVRQIQIQPDVVRMASYGFTLTDLADAARAALALRGAGFRGSGASAGADPDAGAGARSGGDQRRGAGGARQDTRHHRRHRQGDRSPGAALGRCADHGPAGRAAVAGQPVWRQHAGNHARPGSGAGPADPRPEGAGHHDLSRDAPAGQLHRTGAELAGTVAGDRRHPDPGGAVPVPARLALGPDHLPGHSAVAAGGGGGAGPHGP